MPAEMPAGRCLLHIRGGFMDKQQIFGIIRELYDSVSGNIIPDRDDVAPICRGIRLFDEPSVCFGDAADPLFLRFKDPDVIGPWHRTPEEWMPEARTVISLFFPITEEIRRANAAETDHACLQWAYARVEGQEYMNSFLREFADRLSAEGIRTFVPSLSEDFGTIKSGKSDTIPFYEGVTDNTYGSNWSERHAAYVCGLGTFSLTRGLITERGMAGRFASILVDLPLPPDLRPYTGVYDYCIRCGKCASRCPVNAISLENGKDQKLCDAYMKVSKKMFFPRYGCGLCQTGVPCEGRNPAGKAVRRV